jgi:hypothetical protein
MVVLWFPSGIHVVFDCFLLVFHEVCRLSLVPVYGYLNQLASTTVSQPTPTWISKPIHQNRRTAPLNLLEEVVYRAILKLAPFPG